MAFPKVGFDPVVNVDAGDFADAGYKSAYVHHQPMSNAVVLNVSGIITWVMISVHVATLQSVRERNRDGEEE